MVITWKGETGFIPGSGNRPPQLGGKQISPDHVKSLLKKYCQHMERLSGMGRPVASIRELFGVHLVELP